MICPNCHRELSADSRFCNFCGAAVRQALSCGMCGAKLAPGSRFCNVCGAAVEAARAETKATRQGGLSDETLKKLCDMKKLLDAEVINQEEFDRERDELLGRKKAPSAEEEAAAAKAEEQRKAAEEAALRAQEQLRTLESEETELRAQLEQVRTAQQSVEAERETLHAEVETLKQETKALLAQEGAAQENEPAADMRHESAALPAAPVKQRRGRPGWLVPAVAAVVVMVAAVAAGTVIFGKDDAVRALEAQIASIGDVTLQDREDIEKAEEMRAALTPAQLRKVDGLQTLEDARQEYDALYAKNVAWNIENLEKRIDAIGAVTLTSQGQIEGIRAAYNGADAEVRQGIGNYDVLKAAEETLNGLRVSAVEEAILSIGTVTLQSGDAIDAAEDAYDALPGSLRAAVSNSAELTAARDRLKELEAAEKEREKDEALASLRKNEDKVTKNTWYYPSAYPRYANTRCYVLPYIGKNSSGAWLRLKMNYTGDDWVFWEKIIFSIDGSNYTYSYKYSDIFRDNARGDVWENNDIPVNDGELKLLDKIVESEETIVRFQGDDYHHDFTISASDKEAIRQLLLAYTYLK